MSSYTPGQILYAITDVMRASQDARAVVAAILDDEIVVLLETGDIYPAPADEIAQCFRGNDEVASVPAFTSFPDLVSAFQRGDYNNALWINQKKSVSAL